MENLVNTNCLNNLKILVTGHTGFKGAWLCEMLLQQGLNVSGISLPPPNNTSLFNTLNLDKRLNNHLICDIRDNETLFKNIKKINPDIVFHLAAQSLVRRSYREPLLTWETNVIGTLNVLEAANKLSKKVTIVAITTDKVYKNKEWEHAYREEDELGGHDPYSASKAACEIAVDSWRSSFAKPEGVSVVTARAGNVIGPGDYSEDRIIPDCYRAWEQNIPVELRSPLSTRPWQHVLEPLSGYIMLAANTRNSTSSILACNFGPDSSGHCTVEKLVDTLSKLGTARLWHAKVDTNLHEAGELHLSIDRARRKLGWSPLLSFKETLIWTNDGYSCNKTLLKDVVQEQVSNYLKMRFNIAPTCKELTL